MQTTKLDSFWNDVLQGIVTLVNRRVERTSLIPIVSIISDDTFVNTSYSKRDKRIYIHSWKAPDIVQRQMIRQMFSITESDLRVAVCLDWADVKNHLSEKYGFPERYYYYVVDQNVGSRAADLSKLFAIEDMTLGQVTGIRDTYGAYGFSSPVDPNASTNSVSADSLVRTLDLSPYPKANNNIFSNVVKEKKAEKKKLEIPEAGIRKLVRKS